MSEEYRMAEEAYLMDVEEPAMMQKSQKPKNTLKGNRFIKLLAYILLIYSCLAAVFLVVASIFFYDRGMYSANQDNFCKQMIYPMVLEDRSEILRAMWYKQMSELHNDLAGSNLSYAYYDKDGELQQFNHVFDEDIEYIRYEFEDYYYYGRGDEENRRVVIYVRKAPIFEDRYAKAFEVAEHVYPYRHTMPIVAAVHILFVLGLFYFLMCAAGHENGSEGISESVIAKVPFEIITAIFVSGIILGYKAIESCNFDDMIMWMMVFAAGIILGIIWSMSYLTELARRWKTGTLVRYSLTYYLLTGLYKLIDKTLTVGTTVISGVPLVFKTILVLLLISVLELFALLIWGRGELVLFWAFEKLILFPVCIFIAIICKKLLKGTEALAEGRLSYKVNTEKMFGDFKAHGDNLNRISEGISKAVDERIRSEHMKTELISNVSHDIKTPLTSIINYADLIGNEPTENAQIKEYSEVLLRQSKRLKKLLDDLLEASKATTGTLECNFMPCEIGVLLTQACGEYEKRFEESNLELILNSPEQEMTVLADGKHMWRVFDNLLNNICKYSQENSRVYLSVAQVDNKAEIVFRNMSKYALNISAEELEERFVRGDKSRHMEGNGLGLSITRSLVELQNGTMQVLTDGDLFKVILQFEIYEEI